MLLKAARPQCTPAAEQIDAIVAAVLFFVKFRAPDAVGLVILIEEDLSVQPAQLLWRVDVEKEHAAGPQRAPDAVKRLAAILRLRQIVQAVQEAHNGLHRLRQGQALHGLANEERRVFRHGCSLLCSGRQHFLGNVRTDDAIAALRQQHGHRAGAAGKVQHGLWRMPRALQDGLEKLQHGGIVHIGRQPVIRARERFIGFPCFGAHFFSSASTFAKARS